MSNRERILQLARDRARDGETFTKKEAVAVFQIYCNASKHCGEMLTRLVRSGHLDRVNRGVYRLRDPLGTVGPPTPVKPTPVEVLPLFGGASDSTGRKADSDSGSIPDASKEKNE